jgi:hypothetical protein
MTSTRFLLTALAAGLLSATHGFAASPVDYVPSDTPYVFASLKPLPDDLHKRLTDYYRGLGDTIMAGARAQAEADLEKLGADAQYSDAAFALMQEMGNYFVSDEKFAAAGFKPRPVVAMYGVGLVPVMRMEIADASKVSATLEQMLAKIVELDKKNSKREAGSTPMNFKKSALRKGQLFTLTSKTLQPTILVEGNSIAFSLLPVNSGAAELNTIFPAKAPNGKVMGNLSAIKSKYGYADYGVGYLDMQRFADSFLGKSTPLEKKFAKSMDSQVFSETPGAACQSEIRSILANMPRMTTGFTSASANHYTQDVTLELKPSVAAEYAGAIASMPAYGEGKWFKFGMALDVLKLTSALRAQSVRVLDAPYTCETLLSLNESAAKMQEGLNNPAISMAAMVKGFGLAMDSMTMPMPNTKTPEESGDPSNIAANVAIFTDQPETVVAMASGQIPALSTLGLKMDEAPKALPAEAFASIPVNALDKQEGYAAMRKNMIILGVGSNRLNSINSALKRPASSKGEFLEFSYGTGAFEMIQRFSEEGVSEDPQMSPEQKAATQKMMRNMFNVFDSINAIVAFNKNGISFSSETRLKPAK